MSHVIIIFFLHKVVKLVGGGSVIIGAYPVSFLLFQDSDFCTFHDSDCYRAVSTEANDCMVSCTGLYVDVIFSEENILNQKTDLGKSMWIYPMTVSKPLYFVVMYCMVLCCIVFKFTLCCFNPNILLEI